MSSMNRPETLSQTALVHRSQRGRLKRRPLLVQYSVVGNRTAQTRTITSTLVTTYILRLRSGQALRCRQSPRHAERPEPIRLGREWEYAGRWQRGICLRLRQPADERHRQWRLHPIRVQSERPPRQDAPARYRNLRRMTTRLLPPAECASILMPLQRGNSPCAVRLRLCDLSSPS